MSRPIVKQAFTVTAVTAMAFALASCTRAVDATSADGTASNTAASCVDTSGDTIKIFFII